MNDIYVVKRSFKSYGVFYPVGSIITDPSRIKLVKVKCSEGKLILIDSSDKAREIIHYMKVRGGLDIKAELVAAIKARNNPVESEEPKPEVEVEPPKATTKAKKAIKEKE